MQKPRVNSGAQHSRAAPVISFPDSHPSESLNGSQNNSENVRRSFFFVFSLGTLEQLAELFNSLVEMSKVISKELSG